MLCLELFEFVLEMLDVLLLAFAKGALRGSVLGATTLAGVSRSERRRWSWAALTMRMFDTLSLSCCVFDRLLRRSSS